MENRFEDPHKSPVLVHIGQWLYAIFFWVVLLIQILFSVATWRSTVTYDYFCGNPLMSEWAQWFVASVVVGALLLPMGVWSMRHRHGRRGALFLAGFSLYLVSVIFMLIAGAIVGTVPDFFDFIGYAFG